MKYVFPAIFEKENEFYNVSFPDIPSCYTCGGNLTDAMFMAEDALGAWLSRAEEKGTVIPAATSQTEVVHTLGDIVTLILADTDEYRRIHSEKAVKKTLTIPQWLNTAAETKGVNFSQVLQDALKARLGL